MAPDCGAQLVRAARELAGAVEALRFGPPAAYLYNPLVYAWGAHELYLRRFARGTKGVLFLGMNPGPWGMAQTGVPFGDVQLVRDWLGVQAPVGRPPREHPRRPVRGFQTTRGEVSGRRLWSLMRRRFGTPERFFRGRFVANYCPLMFLAEDGKNITPDRLPAADRQPLLEACDRHLLRVLQVLRPHLAVGVGGFAERRIRVVQQEAGLEGLQVAGILHPSPASPRANRDWSGQVSRRLRELGAW